LYRLSLADQKICRSGSRIHLRAFRDVLDHAIEQGLVTRLHVHVELGQIIARQKRGRENDDEVIVFNSTETALQDDASASIIYEKAMTKGLGKRYNFRD
jgi:ornithine cyclodeaminase/alanine dehydrogenase-like protein (mu-crystallin family)